MWWNKRKQSARPVDVIRTHRKSLAIEVRENGDILVRAPMEIPDRGILRFVREHEDWIERKSGQARQDRMQFEEKCRALGLAASYSEEELKDLTGKAQKLLRKKAASYAEMMGTDYHRIAIRRQRSRWGSCSSKGNLNFNCLLMLCPDRVQDYVVVHELAHRFEMNHSQAFWKIVEDYCPDYRKSRAWLKEHGRDLIRRLPDRSR